MPTVSIPPASRRDLRTANTDFAQEKRGFLVNPCIWLEVVIYSQLLEPICQDDLGVNAGDHPRAFADGRNIFLEIHF